VKFGIGLKHWNVGSGYFGELKKENSSFVKKNFFLGLMGNGFLKPLSVPFR
jgi:hypothetical protein